MPTETFFKLNAEKHKRVYDASIEEFCRVPYDEVSIKNIVNTASIARGSFYQYFIDKEDLFLYIFDTLDWGEMELAQSNKLDLFEFITVFAKRDLDNLSFSSGDESVKAKLLKNVSKSPMAIMLLDKRLEEDLKSNPLFGDILERSQLSTISEPQLNGLIDLVTFTIKSSVLQVIDGSKTNTESLEELKVKIDIIKNGIVNI